MTTEYAIDRLMEAAVDLCLREAHAEEQASSSMPSDAVPTEETNGRGEVAAELHDAHQVDLTDVTLDATTPKSQISERGHHVRVGESKIDDNDLFDKEIGEGNQVVVIDDEEDAHATMGMKQSSSESTKSVGGGGVNFAQSIELIALSAGVSSCGSRAIDFEVKKVVANVAFDHEDDDEHLCGTDGLAHLVADPFRAEADVLDDDEDDDSDDRRTSKPFSTTHEDHDDEHVLGVNVEEDEEPSSLRTQHNDNVETGAGRGVDTSAHGGPDSEDHLQLLGESPCCSKTDPGARPFYSVRSLRGLLKTHYFSRWRQYLYRTRHWEKQDASPSTGRASKKHHQKITEKGKSPTTASRTARSRSASPSPFATRGQSRSTRRCNGRPLPTASARLRKAKNKSPRNNGSQPSKVSDTTTSAAVGGGTKTNDKKTIREGGAGGTSGKGSTPTRGANKTQPKASNKVKPPSGNSSSRPGEGEVKQTTRKKIKTSNASSNKADYTSTHPSEGDATGSRPNHEDTTNKTTSTTEHDFTFTLGVIPMTTSSAGPQPKPPPGITAPKAKPSPRRRRPSILESQWRGDLHTVDEPLHKAESSTTVTKMMSGSCVLQSSGGGQASSTIESNHHRGLMDPQVPIEHFERYWMREKGVNDRFYSEVRDFHDEVYYSSNFTKKKKNLLAASNQQHQRGPGSAQMNNNKPSGAMPLVPLSLSSIRSPGLRTTSAGSGVPGGNLRPYRASSESTSCHSSPVKNSQACAAMRSTRVGADFSRRPPPHDTERLLLGAACNRVQNSEEFHEWRVGIASMVLNDIYRTRLAKIERLKNRKQ
ncbi:unnamed protein product [Amoebophrya sp. A25]|nr:unnamed protein product [Amoebophrya sp. A25]|eukprot:GSA25T00012167001.1